MRNAAPTLDNLTGAYGPTWRTGILADDLYRLLDAVVQVVASGRTYVRPAAGGRAVPVLCSELVEIATEDGPITGRCGDHVLHGGFACPGHTAERLAWMATSELERAAIEWREERYGI